MNPLFIVAIISGLLIGLWITGKRTSAFRLLRMSSSANQPALKPGRYFFSSDLKKPKRFDFICYRALTPETGPTLFTHRLCGLPGDIIEIRAGNLYINKQGADDDLSLMHVYKMPVKDISGVVYDETLSYTLPPYPDTLYAPLDDEYVRVNNFPFIRYVLPPGLRDEAIFKVYRKNWNQDHFGPVRVPSGKFFVLGDNRGNSMDSRYQGMIEQSKYVGTVLWK